MKLANSTAGLGDVFLLTALKGPIDPYTYISFATYQRDACACVQVNF